jgi:AraC family transcriptional regulator of adaptative response/methylated-DNA-[protein]-cysteine methyltransferase
MNDGPEFPSEQARWDAVQGRDPTARSAFLYAVTTTGIFCRPGCASRLPKREHVVFFGDAAAARSAGFRPCKRCRPGTPPEEADPTRLIADSCRLIEGAESPPPLEQLAAVAGLSIWHFQRLFKKAVGISPRQYADSCRRRRFRNGLASGQAVTAAIYAAGFNASSRAYEQVGSILGMAPKVFRQGAPDLLIQYAVAPCALGWVLVAATARGICAIELEDVPEHLPARLQADFPRARLVTAEPEFAAVVTAIVRLIETPAAGLDLPLDIQGTAFQRRVWSALQAIPAGTTVSYSELADRLGAPGATRAVARACAGNRLAVAVPCHRVVGRDGSLRGYRWGLERKAALLEREAAGAESTSDPVPAATPPETPALSE